MIIDAVRTPIGRYGGALATVRPDDLAAGVLRALLGRNASLDPKAIDDVYLGCANQSGEDNRNVARMALLLAGIPDSVPGATINRLCASGLDAVAIGARAIACGEAGVILAGGVESMTRAPYVMAKSDQAFGRTAKLVEAVGLRIVAETTDGEASRVHLLRRDERPAAVPAPALMDAAGRLASLDRIAAELGYGLIRFAATGEILDLSPSMLGLLGLDPATASAPELATVIPLAFHSDIVWGLALAEGNGAFENYRIRVRLPGAGETSVLFNVSGFRDADGSIHSLWQAVSREKGTAQLAEGSILSEVRIHNITRNYVPQLVERKARDAVRLGKTALADEERPVAVLFCDIVGFTAYVERHAGDESIIDTLNSILRRVSGSVRRAGGSIDKFMGDCIMALFDDPADAVASAADMQGHAEDINSLRNRAGQQVLQLRIGIHWGEVVIGNVGTAERLDWTAIGDVVNTASRIEKNCPPGEILVSTDVRDAIAAQRPGEFVFGETFGIRVKGKRGEIQVCTAAQAVAR